MSSSSSLVVRSRVSSWLLWCVSVCCLSAGISEALSSSGGLDGLARKLKLKEVSESSPPAKVLEVLEAARRGELEALEPCSIGASFASKRALGVVAEYHRQTPSVLRSVNRVESYEIPSLEAVSGEARRAGAGCLAVNVMAGCSFEDVEKAVKEQQTAVRDFPGPVPVCWTDAIVDEIQLATAYAAGARAVTIERRLAGDDWRDLADKAEQTYGLEPIIVARPRDLDSDSDDDDDLKSRTLLLVGYGEVDDAIELRRSLTAGCVVLKIEAVPGQGLEEAEFAWRARDAGFDAVWLSDALYKFGSFSGKLFAPAPDSIKSVLTAVRSKASADYARASGKFSGRGEGAKEYLGDIMM